MRVLAIETSSLAGGVALMDEECLIAEYRLHVDVRHAERVMGAIDLLLRESRTDISDIDAIAVSIGPGSFTGLRVGLATAKGLAMGSEKPLVLVPTLEAMAAAFPFAKPLIAPFIYAHRGEVYWALFDTANGSLERCHSDTAALPEVALDHIRSLNMKGDGAVLFVGDGAVKYQALILEKMSGQAHFSTRALQFSSAASVAELGLSRLLKGEVCPPDLAHPVYLRVSGAELKRAEAQGKMGS